MQDRKYQVDHIERCVEAVSTKRKVLMQLPTGGGKTVEFSLIAQRFCRNTGKSVLILVHRKELLNQAADAIREIMGIEPYLITSKTDRFKLSRVYIGMVGSTISRLNFFSNVGMVIIDECHIAEFNKVHSIFLEELIIGFSATPKSSSKKHPLNKYYNCIVTGPSIKELIELGFLAHDITKYPKDSVDSSKFQIDTLKGDYNERQMATEYKLPKYVMNVVKAYHKFCKRKKTIIFNVNIEHSNEVAECFISMGFPCRHLASDNEQDRDEILKWFKETENAILCNVMIATVGFDEPTVQNVILNFSTISLVKFIQCCGRGSRPINESFLDSKQYLYPYQLEEKTYFKIIDLGGNCGRFGFWSDDRDWDYIFENPDRLSDGIAPVKTCPVCEGLVHAAVRTCTLINEQGSICGYEFSKQSTAHEQDLEELIFLTKGVDIEKASFKGRRKYQYFPMVALASDVITEMMAKSNGKIPSENTINRYFKSYYLLCIDWYDKNMARKDGNLDDIISSGWHIRFAKNNFDSILKKINQNNPVNLDKETVYPNERKLIETGFNQVISTISI